MNLDTLESLLKDSVRGIGLCLDAKLINSALVLLYCGIDTASSLDVKFASSSVQQRYVKWCDTYMFKGKPLDCTSLELYAARCGVVHETSVESTLSAKGKARQVIYAWKKNRDILHFGQSHENFSTGYDSLRVGINSSGYRNTTICGT